MKRSKVYIGSLLHILIAVFIALKIIIIIIV